MLRQAAQEGGRAALAAFGLPSQPSPGSVGMKMPSTTGLPGIKPPSVPKAPSVGGAGGGTSLGVEAAKVGFAVGMGASTSSNGAGASVGEPADTGRRQRSTIDRAFQRNEDDYATSSMPLPGDGVSP